MKEIQRIFEVLERLDLSREAVVIPLKPATPGTVRVLDDGKNKGKVEIVVDAETPLDDWLPVLEANLRALLES